MNQERILRVRDLKKQFAIDTSFRAQLFGNQDFIHAVDGIDLDIYKGEIIGLAGESGCGKTTTGRCLARLYEPTDGTIYYEPSGSNLSNLSGSVLRNYRRHVQMVFQDPYESINDRFTVREWVMEPLKIHNIGTYEEKENKVIETLRKCGLLPPENFLLQYPHELSGGQRQRVALARAMVLDPSFIVADEPTSMLDVSVRSNVLRVFKDLVEEEDISILYISHDLSLLRYICDRIGIMYRGQLMEIGDSENVLRDPQHPYTQSLLGAVPRVNPTHSRERSRVPPEVEENIGGIQGCPFKDRCGYRFEKCDEDPKYIEPDPDNDQSVYCHLYDNNVDKSLPERDI